MSMPKEWTDKIKAQEQQKEQQKKLEADNIHNLHKEFEHRMNVLLGISPRASVCSTSTIGKVIPAFSILSSSIVLFILVLYIVPTEL